MSNSPISFATERRIHIGLAVSNLANSVAFYRSLFGVEPTKTKDRYARFEVAEPPVNLSLSETPHAKGPTDPVSHFGIQLKLAQSVREVGNRLQSEGLPTRTESEVNCCHAVQEKVWTMDPDGQRWEVYAVLDDAPNTTQQVESRCCAPMASAQGNNPERNPCC